MDELDRKRRRMVHESLVGRGIRDPAVLEAMSSVPREAFLPSGLAEYAYDDAPLPIEAGQTISQPYIVALMAEALRLAPGDRVLEIGTGSGYAAAILARIAREVYTVERHEVLARTAEKRLRELGFANVSVRHGDGTLGWPEHAPYDAIVVAAGGREVPRALIDQLSAGGRLVMPVGENRAFQQLVRLRRTPPSGLETSGGLEIEELGEVRFVPLIGEQS
jgi:protein-L-isoaspartate(D-aspartate) O-methyltransferase